MEVYILSVDATYMSDQLSNLRRESQSSYFLVNIWSAYAYLEIHQVISYIETVKLLYMVVGRCSSTPKTEIL